MPALQGKERVLTSDGCRPLVVGQAGHASICTAHSVCVPLLPGQGEAGRPEAQEEAEGDPRGPQRQGHPEGVVVFQR